MRDLNPKQFEDDPESSIGRDPHEIIADVQAGGDLLMAAVQELIEWTDYDISQLNDYLKRIGNFLHAVIEAHPKNYTIGELSNKLALDEATLRQLLRGVGTEIDIDARDPAETVTERELIPLLADRAGSPVGNRLADLLRGDGPRIVWG
jgi:hypothetical protein